MKNGSDGSNNSKSHYGMSSAKEVKLLHKYLEKNLKGILITHSSFLIIFWKTSNSVFSVREQWTWNPLKECNYLLFVDVIQSLLYIFHNLLLWFFFFVLVSEKDPISAYFNNCVITCDVASATRSQRSRFKSWFCH